MADQAEELRKMMAGQAGQYTPEPSGYREPLKLVGLDIINCDGIIMATVDYTGVQTPADEMIAFGRRIVAAVNACRGVSTADLEKYSEITKYVADVPTMIQQAGQALSGMTRERDEARAKVHDLEATMAGMLEIIQRIEADILALVKVR